jgi:hypothetical protein
VESSYDKLHKASKSVEFGDVVEGAGRGFMGPPASCQAARSRVANLFLAQRAAPIVYSSLPRLLSTRCPPITCPLKAPYPENQFIGPGVVTLRST